MRWPVPADPTAPGENRVETDECDLMLVGWPVHAHHVALVRCTTRGASRRPTS
jgi:hypothetical protein